MAKYKHSRTRTGQDYAEIPENKRYFGTYNLAEIDLRNTANVQKHFRQALRLTINRIQKLTDTYANNPDLFSPSLNRIVNYFVPGDATIDQKLIYLENHGYQLKRRGTVASDLRAMFDFLDNETSTVQGLRAYEKQMNAGLRNYEWERTGKLIVRDSEGNPTGQIIDIGKENVIKAKDLSREEKQTIYGIAADYIEGHPGNYGKAKDVFQMANIFYQLEQGEVEEGEETRETRTYKRLVTFYAKQAQAERHLRS